MQPHHNITPLARHTAPPTAVQLIEITPQMATKMLKNNSVNRHVRRRVVEKYARDMRDGNWHFTHQTIAFSKTGKLLDGQHRLLAIIESGVTITMFVVVDLEDKAQDFMDSGASRTAADVLHMRGKKGDLAPLARIAILYEEGLDIAKGNLYPSNAQIFDWVEKHPEAEGAATIGRKYGPDVMCAPSVVAFASWLIRKRGGEWEDIEKFWYDAAKKVGLRDGDPVLAITKRFALDRAQRKHRTRTELVSGILRIWNHRVRGRRVTTLTYESTGGRVIPIPRVVV